MILQDLKKTEKSEQKRRSILPQWTKREKKHLNLNDHYQQERLLARKKSRNVTKKEKVANQLHHLVEVAALIYLQFLALVNQEI